MRAARPVANAVYVGLALLGCQAEIAIASLSGCEARTDPAAEPDAGHDADADLDAWTCCCHFLDGPVEAAMPDPENNLYPCEPGTVCTREELVDNWKCKYPHP